MGNALKEAKDKVSVADIQKFGEKLIIPTGMSISEAIDLLQRRLKYETEEVTINATFPAFPWDGANAFDHVLTERYGWAPVSSSFFNPAQLIEIEVGYGVFKKVPWGQFKLPKVTGTLQTGVATDNNGLMCFRLQATVLRQHEEEINAICDLVRKRLETHSIYRGKAVSIRFFNDDGEKLKMPTPKFMNTAMKERPIYSRHIEDAIETNLHTPIERVEDCVKNGISVKRGVLLAGVFGTGKTLTASEAAWRAEQKGVTFIYVQRADELAEAIKFSKHYEKPATVLFCEDIDRSLDGDRSIKMDDILNTVDGVESKNRNLITILTTNNIDGIHPAMLRPGRLDAIIEVTPPDAEAVERLLRANGGTAIDASEDLTEAGKVLAGSIPAVITEVVKRAKLHQLRHQPAGTKVTKLTGEALLESAKTMRNQVDLLARASLPKDKAPTIDKLLKDTVVRGTHEYGQKGLAALEATGTR